MCPEGRVSSLNKSNPTNTSVQSHLPFELGQPGWPMGIWRVPVPRPRSADAGILSLHSQSHMALYGEAARQAGRAANQYGISVFCTDFTCKIREYEFGLENTEIELCQFCHLKYCCQNKAYLFWVANQSGFVAFYALEPSNTSLITKTFKLLSSTCSSNMLSCITSCSCSTGSIH